MRKWGPSRSTHQPLSSGNTVNSSIYTVLQEEKQFERPLLHNLCAGLDLSQEKVVEGLNRGKFWGNKTKKSTPPQRNISTGIVDHGDIGRPTQVRNVIENRYVIDEPRRRQSSVMRDMEKSCRAALEQSIRARHDSITSSITGPGSLGESQDAEERIWAEIKDMMIPDPDDDDETARQEVRTFGDSSEESQRALDTLSFSLRPQSGGSIQQREFVNKRRISCRMSISSSKGSVDDLMCSSRIVRPCVRRSSSWSAGGKVDDDVLENLQISEGYDCDDEDDAIEMLDGFDRFETHKEEMIAEEEAATKRKKMDHNIQAFLVGTIQMMSHRSLVSSLGSVVLSENEFEDIPLGDMDGGGAPTKPTNKGWFADTHFKASPTPSGESSGEVCRKANANGVWLHMEGGERNEWGELRENRRDLLRQTERDSRLPTGYGSLNVVNPLDGASRSKVSQQVDHDNRSPHYISSSESSFAEENTESFSNGGEKKSAFAHPSRSKMPQRIERHDSRLPRYESSSGCSFLEDETVSSLPPLSDPSDITPQEPSGPEMPVLNTFMSEIMEEYEEEVGCGKFVENEICLHKEGAGRPVAMVSLFDWNNKASEVDPNERGKIKQLKKKVSFNL